MQKVVVSILHYNRIQDTLGCLRSLLKLDLDGIALTTLIVDNDSKEKFKVDVREFSSIGLKVLVSNVNLGFSGGHNLAYKEATETDFDFFLPLNNDCVVDKNLLKELLKTFEEDERIGASVPKIYFTKGHEFHKDKYKEKDLGNVIWYAGGFTDWKNVYSHHIGVDEVDNKQYDKKRDIDFATGACLLIKKEVISKVGLFDDKYFLYFEDADLSQRIIRAGYRIVYNPKAIVWHNNSASSGSGSELHDYYLSRNRMLFGIKYAPFKIKIALIRESLRLLTTGRIWQKKGVMDYYIGKLGKGSFNP